MIIYVSGPYSAMDDTGITSNIEAARKAAIMLWEAGYTVLCPHLNTNHFEKDCGLSYGEYMTGDLELLTRCDAIYMMEDWAGSKGATEEHEYAKRHHIPIYYAPVMPPVHPTVQNYPVQCEAFMSTIMGMYRTHLDKNFDYSAANILVTGEVGLITRMWDKMGRLLNLYGFKLKMSEPASFEAPKNPKHESVDDSLLDLSVYGIIGKLLREGKWGK